MIKSESDAAATFLIEFCALLEIPCVIDETKAVSDGKLESGAVALL